SRSLATVGMDQPTSMLIWRLGRHDRDGGGRSRDLPGALPDLGELLQLVAIGDHHEVPTLLVAGGWGSAGRFQDLVKVLCRNWLIRELADVATRSHRLERVHWSA